MKRTSSLGQCAVWYGAGGGVRDLVCVSEAMGKYIGGNAVVYTWD